MPISGLPVFFHPGTAFIPGAVLTTGRQVQPRPTERTLQLHFTRPRGECSFYRQQMRFGPLYRVRERNRSRQPLPVGL